MSTSRVAPTAKISDDARFPPTQGAPAAQHPTIQLPTPPPGSMLYGAVAPRPGSIPPTNNPPRIPQTNPGGIPPTGAGRSTPATPLNASLAFEQAAPRRGGTMIAVVVILDLGLAAAGAMLLAKGLSRSAAATKPTTNEAPSPTTKAAGAAPAAAAVVGSSAPEPTQIVDSAPAPTAGTGSTDTKVDRKQRGARKLATGTKSGLTVTPIDPYEATSAPAVTLAPEVDRKAGQSAGVFALCHNNAGAVHGIVDIAFRVLPDGHVTNVEAVENTTGSPELASCLANAIAAWTFPPRTGGAADFVRPFKYD